MLVLHLCVQCTWSSVLAMDDVVHNRFSRAIGSERPGKNVLGSWKVLEIIARKIVGTLLLTSMLLTSLCLLYYLLWSENAFVY